ncbi:uncharacterized protein SCHCODRAFT_01273476 [Schizophyllum commune H4-8]|uniref:uncharacterized protein n=1 Tax=Schizophyllum commune (strain H4-8 / FGSC 9210) TaxID=578458 RepID=UPI00215E7C66|nr:uncharacterized protein SCHCODRAFT_01273476 [Schizophyllum commune H4-8]KAI5899487.1 hypothetical protein SCHCODRAFT_01273476 [Schizophyllum commune H4-8]
MRPAQQELTPPDNETGGSSAQGLPRPTQVLLVPPTNPGSCGVPSSAVSPLLRVSSSPYSASMELRPPAPLRLQ